MCLASLPTIIINSDLVEPYFRGFFCDDRTLQYPLKQNHLLHSCVYILSLLIPLTTVHITAVLHNICNNAIAMLIM